MNFLQVLVGVVVCLVCSTAQVLQTTARPESNEFENFSFIYEHVTKTMLVKQMTNCYIWSLTDSELASIHTDDGMRQVEIRVIKEIDNALYTVLPGNVLNPNIMRLCSYGHQHVHYYLVH